MEYPSKEIIEQGNADIARYMGYEYFMHPCKEPGWRKPKGHLKLDNYYLCRTTKKLQYNTSWEWLIPIIERIAQTTNYYITITDMKPNEDGLFVSFLQERNSINCLGFEGVNARVSVWLAVVAYIQKIHLKTDYGN